jgi:hypothetical protein
MIVERVNLVASGGVGESVGECVPVVEMKTMARALSSSGSS